MEKKIRHEACLEALVHEEHVVLGVRLRPLTLGHWLWLEALENPVVGGGASSLLDLTQAVAVCSVPFPKVARAVRRRSWWRRLWFAVGWTFRWKLEVEAAKFTAYWRDCFPQPDLWSEDEGVEPGLPGAFRLVARLMARGMSREQAWEMPAGEAQFLTLVWAEEAGAEIKWVTPTEMEMMEALKAQGQEGKE